MDLGHMNPVPTLGVHRSVGFIRFSVAGDPGIPFGECYMEPRILRACYCGSFLLAASEGGNLLLHLPLDHALDKGLQLGALP